MRVTTNRNSTTFIASHPSFNLFVLLQTAIMLYHHTEHYILCISVTKANDFCSSILWLFPREIRNLIKILMMKKMTTIHFSCSLLFFSSFL